MEFEILLSEQPQNQSRTAQSEPYIPKTNSILNSTSIESIKEDTSSKGTILFIALFAIFSGWNLSFYSNYNDFIQIKFPSLKVKYTTNLASFVTLPISMLINLHLTKKSINRQFFIYTTSLVIFTIGTVFVVMFCNDSTNLGKNIFEKEKFFLLDLF